MVNWKQDTTSRRSRFDRTRESELFDDAGGGYGCHSDGRGPPSLLLWWYPLPPALGPVRVSFHLGHRRHPFFNDDICAKSCWSRMIISG
jgi:hypothetical protein